MKILLVDDDKAFASSVLGALEMRGHEVVWAPFSQDAEDALYDADYEGAPFDCAIVDWDLGLLSAMDGDGVTRLIKRDNPTMGVLLWSGMNRPEVDEADAQLVKSDIDELFDWLKYEAELRGE